VNQSERTLGFRWRAEPDCYEHTVPLIQGEWFHFQQEIYWTNDNDGYFKLWMNGEMVREESGIKTLFDNFRTGDCNLYWSVGIYSSWSGSREEISLYIDNIEIWDTSGVEGIIGEEVSVRAMHSIRPVDEKYQIYGSIPYTEAQCPDPSFYEVLDVKGRTREDAVVDPAAGIYLQKKQSINRLTSDE
jgi:hypothetical protein